MIVCDEGVCRGRNFLVKMLHPAQLRHISKPSQTSTSGIWYTRETTQRHLQMTVDGNSWHDDSSVNLQETNDSSTHRSRTGFSKSGAMIYDRFMSLTRVCKLPAWWTGNSHTQHQLNFHTHHPGGYSMRSPNSGKRTLTAGQECSMIV